MLTIETLQSDYHDLLKSFSSKIEINNFDNLDIIHFIENIRLFWIKNLPVISRELSKLVSKGDSLLLCGEIYLDTSNYEHFYYKTFGDYHFLYDPFLKLEKMFITIDVDDNYSELRSFFCRVYKNTIDLLTNHSGYFYILPIQDLVTHDFETHMNEMNDVFLQFLNRTLNKEFKSSSEFISHYESYEQIEADTISIVRNTLIYTDNDDIKLSLKEKLEKYIKHQGVLQSHLQSLPEAEQYYILTSGKFFQILDQISAANLLGLIPYVIQDSMFTNILVLNCIIPLSEVLGINLEKSGIFILFRNNMPLPKSHIDDFPKYVKATSNVELLENIHSRIKTNKIKMFEADPRPVVTIIEDEFFNCFVEK